jgi:hypothetical protein
MEPIPQSYDFWLYSLVKAWQGNTAARKHISQVISRLLRDYNIKQYLKYLEPSFYKKFMLYNLMMIKHQN